MRWLFRLVALAALVALGFAAWLWWDMRSWRPDAALYPEQGAVIASGASGTRFETLRAIGAGFVYLDLAATNGAPDPGFAARLQAALASGLKVGIIQPFDPCLRADEQSARFTRMVPRDGDLLPPAIALSRTATGCEPSVSDAAVESELLTLINQIEMHSGAPVILKVASEFEERHSTARSIGRDLWLVRDRARPDYAGRPWLLWSANSQLVSEASEEPIEWVVVQR
ncbi:glycoside hydrolase family 25 protein [uncultured Erythrobacter sp.]|uniref:glycoside hydrolase family 25 protein n=1 Tax=uncultured Erythrobacter sp. TaxID=263913 RepID=UPI00261D2F24|nr:glycoside hydrolase family 25 protein [uncultured Erythrobacter sp.]